MSDSIYKSVLLDHFRNPRNKGGLKGMPVVKRGSNPQCGDDIEIGLHCESEKLVSVRFHGRGCSVCLASASMMSECVKGLGCQQAVELSTEVKHWLTGESDSPPSPGLAALDAVRGHSARRKCVMLAWKALDDALDSVMR